MLNNHFSLIFPKFFSQCVPNFHHQANAVFGCFCWEFPPLRTGGSVETGLDFVRFPHATSPPCLTLIL